MVRASLVLTALFAALLQLAVAGCVHSPQAATPANSVAAFLDGADFQAETDDQRREVLRALDDLLKLPPEALRARRYASYSGQPGARDIVALLKGHFVPNENVTLTPGSFYSEVRAPEAQAAIRTQRDRLQSALENANER